MKNSRKFILICVACVGIAAAGVGAYSCFNPKEETANSGSNISVEKDVVAWDGELQSENDLQQESIKVPYYGELTAQTDKKDVGVTLVNPKENNCYFSYTWEIADTGEEIYKSNLIEPGMAIDGIQMNEILEAGTYAINMQIDTYSMDDQQPMNKAVVETTLVVS